MTSARFILASLSFILLQTSHTAAETLCGRPNGTISERLIEMQKPEVEALHRDARLMVFRDLSDASLWVFSLKNTTAHPSVICSRDVEKDGAKVQELAMECTATEKACQSFEEMARAQIEKHRAASGK